jgi:hypothetical protein
VRLLTHRLTDRSSATRFVPLRDRALGMRWQQPDARLPTPLYSAPARTVARIVGRIPTTGAFT